MPTETRTESRPRFGLIDLMWIAALVAVFVRFIQLASGGELDPLTIVFALILLLPVLALPTRRFTLVEILVLLALSGVLFGLRSNWFVIAYCGTLFALILVRSAQGIRDRIRWQTCSLLLAIFFGSFANHFVPPRRVAWLREARTVFPKVNMAPRLASLQPALSVAKVPEAVEQSELASEYSDDRFRIHRLRNVHDAQYERFIEGLGFGPARMISLYADQLTLPDLENIDFSDKHATVPSETVFRSFHLSDKPVFNFENMEPLGGDAIVQRTYVDFLHPITLGYSPQRKQAVGFSPHGFRFPLPRLEHEPHSLRLTRLELVSVLNFETPQVYVLDHLPRMDQLRGADAPTREVDLFEVSGLSQLRMGKKIVIEDESQRVRMLGPILMIEQCQQCHDGDVGDMLGAFSYEFGR